MIYSVLSRYQTSCNFTRFSPPLDLVKFYPSLPSPPFEIYFNPLSSTVVFPSQSFGMYKISKTLCMHWPKNLWYKFLRNAHRTIICLGIVTFWRKNFFPHHPTANVKRCSGLPYKEFFFFFFLEFSSPYFWESIYMGSGHFFLHICKNCLWNLLWKDSLL